MLTSTNMPPFKSILNWVVRIGLFFFLLWFWISRSLFRFAVRQLWNPNDNEIMDNIAINKTQQQLQQNHSVCYAIVLVGCSYCIIDDSMNSTYAVAAKFKREREKTLEKSNLKCNRALQFTLVCLDHKMGNKWFWFGTQHIYTNKAIIQHRERARQCSFAVCFIIWQKRFVRQYIESVVDYYKSRNTQQRNLRSVDVSQYHGSVVLCAYVAVCFNPA